MNSIRLPVHPITEDTEIKQTVAVFYYSFYHGECLNLFINDTLNESMMNLQTVMHSVNTKCLSITNNHMNNMQVSVIPPEHVLSNAKNFMGSIPLPPSMNGSGSFMSNIGSAGMILENLVQDWRLLKETCKDGSPQVNQLISEVVDVLRCVYMENPEYKYTMELIQLAQSSVVEVGFTQKYFFQSCIIAAQIQASCLSLGLLQLVGMTASTVPCTLYKCLITEGETIFPNASESFFGVFQKKMYEIYKIFQSSTQYCICEAKSAPFRFDIIKTGVSRAFRSLQSLLRYTPLYNRYESELQQGISMASKIVPAQKENVKYCLAKPSCMIDVHTIYDMIRTERSLFLGKPTDVMIARWGHTLNGLITFLASANKKGSELYQEIYAFCLQILNRQ